MNPSAHAHQFYDAYAHCERRYIEAPVSNKRLILIDTRSGRTRYTWSHYDTSRRSEPHAPMSLWFEDFDLHLTNPELTPYCVICLELFSAHDMGSYRVRIACGHRHFCLGCIAVWFSQGYNTCPFCRQRLW